MSLPPPPPASPFRCKKCGSLEVHLVYESVTDRLECKCRRCSYFWTQLPLDDSGKRTPEPDPVPSD